MISMMNSVSFLLTFLLTVPAWGFTLAPALRTSSMLASSPAEDVEETKENVLRVSLEKPLGMMLEEVEEGAAKGVYVLDLAEEGSAASSEYKDILKGLTISTVMGEDCTSLMFDDVMDKLINAPSTVNLEFLVAAGEVAEEEPLFEVGTVIQIKVLEDGDKKETILDAKVGDNLRQTLLDNNIEVYKGMKKKLGNCGGGGQCTFCAADFVESEGWAERSDYEDKKLKRFPNARLSCLNNIQGPATIRI